MRSYDLVVLGISLASCGNGEGGSPNKAVTSLELTSDAFKNGRAIPAQYTCDGTNQSPGLSWAEPPSGTRSFALIIDDPDAPGGTFRHWGVYDIPSTARSMVGGKQSINDMGKAGYGGPCPPKGDRAHHYHFKLFALDVEKLGLPNDAKVVDVENAAAKHEIGQGELIGTYERR
jgi:Raf kinase inhibitor-like YbhB/YbcL family protein